MRGRKPYWRPEQGPGYDLRQYQGSRPTGLVAVTAWDHPIPGRPSDATGPDIRLVRQGSRLLVEELGASPSTSLRLQIPLGSCVAARLAGEPGLPGEALIRLTLVVRLGRAPAFSLPLWFASRSQAFLRGLVDEITAQAGRPPRGVRASRRSEPARAPSHQDWVVFRAAAPPVTPPASR
ncbi:hypothetical protein [Amycolatopsis sp. cmx-11-12]|uniref:hypothetical protein n=1 Tax=Amycolatopsis sp. cmx-11-12 TaxID=2785795 RepID=UPI0039170FF0